jgi:signal transduction histidine kinase
MRRIYPKSSAKPPFTNFLIAVVTVAAALFVGLTLGGLVDLRATPLFLAAVAVTAWRGGKYPSIFAAVLAVLAIDYFIHPPIYEFELSADAIINSIVFLLVALLISWNDDERKKNARQRDELLESEREARRAAEEADRAKDVFLAMVTHELRSPLNAILGWTRMLKTETLDRAQTGRALDVIERSARTQARLVEDLLDISRIRAGKFCVNAEPVDLCPLVDDAVEAVAAGIVAKRIRLHRELDRRIGLINGDAERLRQIVWNLLSNAVKFTPEGGQIEISLERANNHVRLKICDDGAGITADFLPFVFDSFRQSDEGNKAGHKGLGLGLAIVRHLTEAHGGTVRAHSAGAGLGATFTVELPLLCQEDAAAPTKNVEAANH